MNKIKSQWAPLLGPILFLFFYFSDFGFNEKQTAFLAVFIFTVYNWLIARIPLYATGFIGVGLSCLLGVEKASDALASFAHPIVFLFLAGFLFARSMSEIGLDKRASLYILSRKFVHSSFDRLIFAIFSICAFFSLWVSNTATTAMMLPIVLGIMNSLGIRDDKARALILLGLAYSSSVGGIGSPVGSTPNIIVIGMLEELVGIKIGFFQWLSAGIPLVAIFIFIVYFYIKSQIPEECKKVDTSFIKQELEDLCPITKNEKWYLSLFITLVAAWFLPGLLGGLFGSSYPMFKTLDSRMSPGITGIFLSGLLFMFPLGNSTKLLKSSDIKNIDWGSLLLFGSGLSLGKTLFTTGLAQMAGDFLVANILGTSFFILILALTLFTIFSTELASNTATANILLPIIIAASGTLGLNPALPAIAVALACSLAFMLPVATPPNAIVFGSGKIEVSMMVKFGFLLNIIFALAISILFYFLKYLL